MVVTVSAKILQRLCRQLGRIPAQNAASPAYCPHRAILINRVLHHHAPHGYSLNRSFCRKIEAEAEAEAMYSTLQAALPTVSLLHCPKNLRLFCTSTMPSSCTRTSKNKRHHSKALLIASCQASCYLTGVARTWFDAALRMLLVCFELGLEIAKHPGLLDLFNLGISWVSSTLRRKRSVHRRYIR